MRELERRRRACRPARRGARAARNASAANAQPLSEFAARHRDVLAALSLDNGNDGRLRRSPTAQSSRTRSTSLRRAKPPRVCRSSKADYVELFAAALAGRVVRRPLQPGLRVRILGPLEARLTESDRVVLGGLVEGVWPPESNTDAWLSRPMRLALGLDLPERRIGLSAHDFAQLLGAREVILSHAAKIAGTPTVPSRFIQRLAAVAGTRWEGAVATRREISGLGARARPAGADRAGAAARAEAAARGAAEEPFGHRDRTLAARSLYDLRQAHSCACGRSMRSMPQPGAAERGTIIHAAIGDFTKLYAEALPADPVGELIALGEPHFAALEDFPEARAFWWPRFQRIAHWFARWDARAPRRDRRDRGRNSRRDRHRARRRRVQAARHRRPHRTRCRRPLRHPRLQDRLRAQSKSRCAPGSRRSSRWKPRCCAEAASGKSGRRFGRRSSSMCCSRAASRPANMRQSSSRTARRTARPIAALEKLTALARRFDDESDAVSLARPSDVDDALRRLRPSRARQGMVERPAAIDDRGRRMRTPDDHPVGGARAAARRSPIRTSRRGSPPMPARARRMCWRSA